jgi:hypothetical protein
MQILDLQKGSRDDTEVGELVTRQPAANLVEHCATQRRKNRIGRSRKYRYESVSAIPEAGV